MAHKKQSYPICGRTGKRQYESEEHATVLAGFLPARFPNRQNVTTLRAYLCPFCNQFHITHQAFRPKERKNEVRIQS